MDNGLFGCSDVLWVLGGDKPSPGTLFGVHQGTDYTETDKPSAGTLLGVHQGTDYID